MTAPRRWVATIETARRGVVERREVAIVAGAGFPPVALYEVPPDAADVTPDSAPSYDVGYPPGTPFEAAAAAAERARLALYAGEVVALVLAPARGALVVV